MESCVTGLLLRLLHVPLQLGLRHQALVAAQYQTLLFDTDPRAQGLCHPGRVVDVFCASAEGMYLFVLTLLSLMQGR